MADKSKYRDNGEKIGIGADKTDSELDQITDADKLQDTRALGRYKPKPNVEESDPDKMSPLARAAYLNKRKKVASTSPTTDDAAAALGSR